MPAMSQERGSRSEKIEWHGHPHTDAAIHTPNSKRRRRGGRGGKGRQQDMPQKRHPTLLEMVMIMYMEYSLCDFNQNISCLLVYFDGLF